ncbi:phosphatidic acid phosphatase type 2/haloperoxidase [Polychytrium aggregatum]|uniref:phosphatidic acid phosphatase type 2/haloperoxidase n=1 Tax=Polychytrium aggregatum TaxID=110093 RepID=UPI0022FDBCA9|nr:phosphatidic acid phosphatase type 2/haloperoxidase [Polychytrium aggregatum]KAI9205450.1 phosphatidic acid phosphatase type 2/haloperoxidase [Polychytrium aggregatum]
MVPFQCNCSKLSSSSNFRSVALAAAAYTVLVDLFPGCAPAFKVRYETSQAIRDASRLGRKALANGIYVGQEVARRVLKLRHLDCSNQLGSQGGFGNYSDYTLYTSMNLPSVNVFANRWQPLRLPLGGDYGAWDDQVFVTSHWGLVRPFSPLNSEAKTPGSTRLALQRPSDSELALLNQQMIAYSANLTDGQKMEIEFWGGPNEPAHTLPAIWTLFAENIAIKQSHTLKQDVVMFLYLSNALHDAAIAAWDMKRALDSARPITSIRTLLKNQPIVAWGGPFKGTLAIFGQDFVPYAASDSLTPSSPEFVSDHAAFSSAAVEVLQYVTRSNRLGLSFTFRPGSSRVEPGRVPAKTTILSYKTLADALDAATQSQVRGGFQYPFSIQAGLTSGQLVASRVIDLANNYINGTATY